MSVWPDWAIYLTLCNFSKHQAAINLPKSTTFVGNYCKGVKILAFSSEFIFGQLLWSFGNFILVTLLPTPVFIFDNVSNGKIYHALIAAMETHKKLLGRYLGMLSSANQLLCFGNEAQVGTYLSTNRCIIRNVCTFKLLVP